ncbi:beta-1,4-glucuronyltransferase 1-like [Eriocheir sinensis]|uniref:beta-1,4-glucuronyltransferase 1-like n=1 Tax=Eriocheir sinensis TaxID=95602 RepID=UPI0021C945F0|nr:beta-1,4-glucuronyltransferase 1-like [Eriocheir sinensis]
MVQMLCRVWGVGMLSIMALTTSNIILTLRLMQGRGLGGCGEGAGGGGMAGGGVVIPQTIPRSWTSALASYNQSEYLAFLKVATVNTSTTRGGGGGGGGVVVGVGDFEVVGPKGRWDARRSYKTHDHVYTGPHYVALSQSSSVCLATQTSVDRLFWLAQVARYWTAPMSVSVFTPDVEYGIARAYLTYLVTCFPFLGEKATFHFTSPKSHPPRDLHVVIDRLEEKCDQPLGVLKTLLKKRDAKMLLWRERMPYPQNVLRNVARKNCDTEYVFLADVDIVPIPGLSTDLAAFLDSKTARTCKK